MPPTRVIISVEDAHAAARLTGQRDAIRYTQVMYWIRARSEDGDLFDLAVEPCWRCGCLVDLSLFDMAEHADRCHPPVAAPPPRHALRD